MKAPFLFSFLFIVSICTAQVFPEKLPVSEIDIKTIAKGTPVTARSFSVAPYQIIKQKFLADSSLLCLYMVNPADKVQKEIVYVLCFDLEQEKVLYSLKIKGVSTDLTAFRRFVIREKDKKSTIYNAYTGEKIWSVNEIMAYVNDILEIGITYSGVGYDMMTGKHLWNANINNEFGWGNYYLPDSNVLIIGANGLKCIDVKTGASWFVPNSIGVSNFSGERVSFAEAFFQGTQPSIPLKYDKMYRMCSNILMKDDCYFMAGNEYMICVEKNGRQKWKTRLHTDRSGSSLAWFRGDTIILVSRGFGVWMGSNTYADAPFVMALDNKTGKIYYYMPLGHRTVVLDMVDIDDYLYLLCDDALVKYDMHNGGLILRENIDRSEAPFKGGYALLRGTYAYLTGSTSGKSLQQMYPGSTFLYNNKKQLLRLDETFKPHNLIQDYYVQVKGKLNDSLNYTVTDKKLLFDKKGRTVMEFEIKPDWIVRKTCINIEKDYFVITRIPNL